MEIASLLPEMMPKVLDSIEFETKRYLMGTLATLVGLWFIVSHFIKGRKIRKASPRRRQLQQIAMELKNSAKTVVVFAAMNTVLFNGPIASMFQIYKGDASTISGQIYFWLSVPLYIVLHDAYFYWTHRAMHHRSLYRYFHMTHHRSHNPTPFTAYNFAPLEAVVNFSFLPTAVLLIPIHNDAIYIVMTIMIFKNASSHAGYEIMPRSWAKLPVLGWLTTVTHHDMHHERGSANFGFYFTWWDNWMGTEHADYHERLERQLARDMEMKAARKAGQPPVAAE
ncbi:MAG: sterol desaturase family protein [Pseudomonadota bacterium]